MAQRDNMPEGTDSIIDGASGSSGAGYGGSAGSTGGTGYAGDLGTAGGAGYGGGLGTTADAMGAASGADLGGGSDFGSNAGTGGSSTSAFGSSASTGSDGMGSGSMGGQSSSGSGGSGISGQVQNLKSQATDKARQAAMQGKDRATDALGNVSTMVRDAAQMIDERLGGGYGEYARKAAGTIDGLTDQIRNKEVDELLNDARGFIRRSPGAAIGIAATAGFLLVRVLKAAGSGATGTGMGGSGMSSGAAANDGATPPMVESRGGVA